MFLLQTSDSICCPNMQTLTFKRATIKLFFTGTSGFAPVDSARDYVDRLQGTITMGFNACLPQVPVSGILTYGIDNVLDIYQQDISFRKSEITDLQSLEAVLHDVMISLNPGSSSFAQGSRPHHEPQGGQSLCFSPASGGFPLGSCEHMGPHGGHQQYGVGLHPWSPAVAGPLLQPVANMAVLHHVILLSLGMIQEPVGVYCDTVTGTKHYGYDINGCPPVTLGAHAALLGGDFVHAADPASVYNGSLHGFPLHYS